VRRGLGLSPDPFYRRSNFQSNSNNIFPYHNKYHRGGERLAQPLPVHSPAYRKSRVRLPAHTKLLNNHKPITGCHVAAHDWATWHLNHQPKHATCQSLIGPHVPHQLPYCHLSVCVYCPVILPRHLLTSPVPRVTLSVVTRVTSG
jgi:hypothetical protein